MVNLKTTVATTRLGWLWWIVDPLVMMWIYYFMVKVVFNRGGEDYHLFALIGIVSWQFFAKTVKLTAATLQRNKQLLTHTRIPLEIATVIPTLIQAFFALIGYVIVVVWNCEAITVNVLYTIPIMFVIALFSMAIGAVMSICVVFVPDINKFLDYGLRVGFFITPILYSASRVTQSEAISETVKALLSLNPMMWAITELRGVILYATPMDMSNFFIWLTAGLVALQLSILFVRMNRQNIMKYM